MRALLADARKAAQGADIRALTEMVQTPLVMPFGGPSALSGDEGRVIVEAAARIVSTSMTTGLMWPTEDETEEEK